MNHCSQQLKKQQAFDLPSASDSENVINEAKHFSQAAEFVESDDQHLNEEPRDDRIDALADEALAAYDGVFSANKLTSRRFSVLAKLSILGMITLVLVQTGLSFIALWHDNIWLFSLYAVVLLLISLWVGKICFGEWRQLVALKARQDTQEAGTRLTQSMQMGEADKFIDEIIERLPKSVQIAAYQAAVNSEHNDAEKLILFNELVLAERDNLAKKIVRRYAQESALLLAASPLALLDMLIILWRNQRMIQAIAKCYGIELGYWSRIKLIRSIITNVIYAGSSEVIIDLGTQLLSVEMSGKLSARLGQGLGGGLLTARLGYQAMAFCRPLTFTQVTKPKLSGIHKELLRDLKHFSAEALTKKASTVHRPTKKEAHAKNIKR